MATVKVKEIELPVLPPKNWKRRVAEVAGVSEKTVYNAIRRGIKGPQSNKVMEVYKNLYGRIVATEKIG
ncbi:MULTISPECIES: hypothetical protein [Parabacteroides]|uniref:hypothetical protein n=1 Tax=Parabacteroides provencensis TaxID=1944636 RepID=UPI000C15384A|nr:hypothetical protein [Parabacteroides provencensis]